MFTKHLPNFQSIQNIWVNHFFTCINLCKSRSGIPGATGKRIQVQSYHGPSIFCLKNVFACHLFCFPIWSHLVLLGGTLQEYKRCWGSLPKLHLSFVTFTWSRLASKVSTNMQHELYVWVFFLFYCAKSILSNSLYSLSRGGSAMLWALFKSVAKCPAKNEILMFCKERFKSQLVSMKGFRQLCFGYIWTSQGQ